MSEKTEGWEIRITEMDLFAGLDLSVMGEIADIACTEATHPALVLSVYRRLSAVFNKRLSNNYHRFLSI